ncbi:TetR/AcrR family transcriptional regulator [Actinoplanes bogorensis]|uniref:TetR/AcrR family transcriptional regulator n=1 Tax=Paractinoplanes bogorensis TaxID=1610840 RepID=A0ABS5Z593_9ACTN|nr:TetR/AcrR family transcriptional regulator [Actinoplanes bogorensis]MBU2670787.1 TetR/AcrR family transcriptional regulator [Actinoplanes bogorensis]
MSLRERKRARTRQALVDAAAELFESKGYDGTTIADIAAAAEIGTRTFFSYFAAKEDLLFPEAEARLQAALDAIADRAPGDRPADVLLVSLRHVSAESDEIVSPMAALRLDLIRTVPSVRGKGLQLQQDAQLEIARHLAAAFPGELDLVSAAALTGAFVGAVTGALLALFAEPERREPAALHEAMQAAVDQALAPWRG